MDWEKLKYFYQVAKFEGLTHAAKHLNLSQSALSRSMQSLEDDLKVPLFERTSRGLKMSKQGEILFDCVKKILAETAVAQLKIQECQNEMKGDLKIAATMGFSSLYLSPHLPT